MTNLTPILFNSSLNETQNIRIMKQHGQYNAFKPQSFSTSTSSKRFETTVSCPFPSKLINISSSNPTIDINDRRNIKYICQGEEYDIQDKDFIKNRPCLVAPQHEDTGLSLFSQL